MTARTGQTGAIPPHFLCLRAAARGVDGRRRACRIVWGRWLEIGVRCGLLGLNLQQFESDFDIGTGSLLKSNSLDNG